MSSKKKIRVNSIEPDPRDPVIVVSYVVETTTFDDRGEVVSVDKKPNHKKIHVKNLNSSTDIPSLAQEIVDSYNVITQSKLSHVEKILHFLLQRMEEQETEEDLALRRREHERMMEAEYMQEMADGLDMNELERYIEMLYEGMDDKVKGTLMILQLARNPDNLERLIQQETLLGVLSRLLKEDSKRSTDLVINIMYIFFSFSNFSEFHSFLAQYHVGEMTMKVIELEIKRHELRIQELEDLNKAVKSGEKTKDDVEATSKKNKIQTKKQEKLLYVCFHVLLNLAEDVSIEKKMKKRRIVPLLCAMLERKNSELLILVLSFLKKLSIYKENKDEMAELNIVEKLCPYVRVSNEAVVVGTLRLLVNLSFDPELRDKMVKNSLIPQLVELMLVPQLRGIVLKLLYHISMDDKCKSMFSYTDCVPLVLRMVLENPEPRNEDVLIALTVNLSANSRNAELMADGDTLRLIIARTLRFKDNLLCKVVRNISQHEACKSKFAEFIPDLANALVQCQIPDLLVELLGTLGNLNLPDFSYARLLIDFDLISFLYKMLVPGAAEDDIVLEIVIFIGTIATDENCAPLLANSRIMQALYDLMAEKQEDDEIVLQITFTFYKFIQWPETRQQLLANQNIISYLIDFLRDSNSEIRKMADQTLDIIMDVDDDWAKKIRLRKFEIHNSEWVRAIAEEEERAGIAPALFRERHVDVDDDFEGRGMGGAVGAHWDHSRQQMFWSGMGAAYGEDDDGEYSSTDEQDAHY